MSSEVAQGAPRRLGRLAATVRALFARTLDLALPQLCPACRAPVVGEALCAPCWSRVSFIAAPYCARLGIPFPYDPGPGTLSIEAMSDPPAYNRARAAVRFDETARTLVHALKYGDRLDLAPIMGRWMANAGRELTADADLLVPVPLHWRRQWARRFNQSALLADVVGKASGLTVGLARTERALNVQGAFRARASAQREIEGRRLILVDDVLTSGATLEACARALLRAGVAQVDVLVFARVVAPARIPI